MRTLYLDLFSGISGDMFVGALLDLGVDAARLEQELGKLRLQGYHLHVSRTTRGSIQGVKFDVHLESDHGPAKPASAHEHGPVSAHHPHAHHHNAHGEEAHSHGHEHAHPHAHGVETEGQSRTFAEIEQLIGLSPLSPWVKQKSVAIFRRIAIAEGKVHGLPPEQVHFHEVGAVDSIVDIVGACVGLELLGRPRVLASAVVEGAGWVDCAHGRFPVPSPATLAILGARGIAVTQCEERHELVTPTGAALLAELVEQFGPMDALIAHRVGFGLGARENQTRPNVLRAVLGEAVTEPSIGLTPQGVRPIDGSVSGAAHVYDWVTDTVVVLEANIDDINPEILGQFVENALAAGALDVFHTPIQMKKNRPGVLLTVLCGPADADKFTESMLRETSSFGVRRHFAERRKLVREFVVVQTPYGAVTLKLGRLQGEVVQAAPEFESCKQIAAAAKVPLKTIYEAAVQAFRTGRGQPEADASEQTTKHS